MQNKLPQIIWLASATIALLASGCEEMLRYAPPLPRIELPSNQPPQPVISAESAKIADMEAAVRQGINQVRQQNGLQPLQNNEKLTQVARHYSLQMAQKNSLVTLAQMVVPYETEYVQAESIIGWLGKIYSHLPMCRNLYQPPSKLG